MNLLKKSLSILAIAFAVAAMPNLTQAHCGSCGSSKQHKHKDEHKKDACVRCGHEKVCDIEDCDDPAHQAPCTCPKK